MRKPLVLLEDCTSLQIIAARMVRPAARLAATAAAEPVPERCFRRLLGDGERLEAARFLAAALRRRVQVWWGYRCVRAVMMQGREHRARLAATGGGVVGLRAAAAAAATAAPGAPLMGVSPDLGIDLAAMRSPPPLVAGTDLADPASWPRPALAADGTLTFLPPVLEPLRRDPRRRPDACDVFFAERQAFIDRLAPEARRVFLAEDATSAAEIERLVGRPLSEVMALDRDEALRRAGAGLDADPTAAHNRLRSALAAKKAEVQAAVAQGMQRLDQALAHLPHHPPDTPPGDGPEAGEALRAARAWILNPVEENGRAALAVGEKCQGLDQAAGFIAMACHYSGGDLSPHEGGEAPVPPPPPLAPTLVATALELARAIPDTGSTPDEWLQRFLDDGLAVAQGLRTWDELLQERATGTHPWAGRAGFGRQVAPPAPPDDGLPAARGR
jgi:hypothetical protein